MNYFESRGFQRDRAQAMEVLNRIATALESIDHRLAGIGVAILAHDKVNPGVLEALMDELGAEG